MTGRSKAPLPRGMVNVPVRRQGIDCAECGLPGLGVREITVAIGDGPTRREVRMRALACCYCHRAVALGTIGEVLTYTP
jgi:hypothetical protein